ncbi:ABC transporter substrate-binding protein [Streptomyces phytohabitans]|uniref:ABC transporter substrate-binding protein n=1 Tax=Streptomyces phytohabitans TaxID=1150371 RepID=UPI00345B8192
MRARVRGGAAGAALIGLLAAGCGGVGDAPPDGTGTASGGFPVTVGGCAGAVTTFAAPPRRIVTDDAASLELLLRLGAGDRVIGTGFPAGTRALTGALGEVARRVEVLSEGGIPKERLLASGADLHVSTFGPPEGAGSGGGGGDVPTAAEFEAVGIQRVQLRSTACPEDADGADGPVTDLSAVEADVTALGAVTGTSARARQLVAGMRAEVAAARKVVAASGRARPTYFFFDYDAGTRQPVAVCNRQVAHAVITLAGARNLFAGCDGTHERVGWEDVIAGDPEWIQLGVRHRGGAAADREAFDEAERWLRTNPATRGLAAVEERRFVRVGSEATTIAGVGNAHTVRRIAEILHGDGGRGANGGGRP